MMLLFLCSRIWFVSPLCSARRLAAARLVPFQVFKRVSGADAEHRGGGLTIRGLP